MTDKPQGEGRRVSRYPYAGEALVSFQNEQFTCRAVDIGVNSLILIPPSRATVGVYARMNLSLPGLDEVIDVDGIVTRETKADGYYAVEVRFHDSSRRAAALLATFVRWRESRQRAGTGLHRLSTSPGMAAVRRRGTGPNLDAIPKSATQELIVDPDVGRYTYTRPLTPEEQQQSSSYQPAPQARRYPPQARDSAELRQLYREALEDLKRDEKK